MNIEEWFIEFVKARDVFQKKIKEFKKTDYLEIHYTDKTTKVLENPTIEKIKSFAKKDAIVILFPNKLEHIDWVVKNWDILKEYQDLTIYFINPDSNLEKKWAVKPFVHERVTERPALKQGLLSLFETVEKSS